jgi:hypothetical protein
MEKSSNFTIPSPYPWQADFPESEKRLDPRLSVAVIGRRAGKSTLGLLHWLLNSKGLEAGHDAAWVGPNDKVIQIDVHNY